MERTVVIGNAGGGKSTLARKLAARRRLPHIEIDALLWRPGWQLTPSEIYDAEHTRAIAQARWVIDGLGRRESIAARLRRATGGLAALGALLAGGGATDRLATGCRRSGA